MLKWLKKILPKRNKLHKESQIAVLGDSAKHPSLWRFTREAVARGVAVGFIAAFIPLPVQMLSAALLSVIVRGNIAVAAAATWITNPFTFVPLNMFIFKVGQAILNDPQENFKISDLNFQLKLGTSQADIIKWLTGLGKPYLLGLVIVTSITAIVGYLLVHVCWLFFNKKIKKSKKITKTKKSKNYKKK